MTMNTTQGEPITGQSRYLVQLTRKELVQVFAAVQQLRDAASDPEAVAFNEAILHKLAQSQENGPVPICEMHQIPMVRMKGKHGPFWSCHQRNDDGSFCTYRPPKAA
jgi:hypothetical protein